MHAQRARRRGGWEREVVVLHQEKWCSACSQGRWRGRGESLREGSSWRRRENGFQWVRQRGRGEETARKGRLVRKEQQKGEQLGHQETDVVWMEESDTHFLLFLYFFFSCFSPHRSVLPRRLESNWCQAYISGCHGRKEALPVSGN